MQLSTAPEQAAPPAVYVVDDDPGVRKSLEMVFAAADLQARVFDSAESFLNACDDRGPACLILDMHMPGMNGAELIAALRERGSMLPVIVVTGTATVRLAVQTMKLGAIDFHEKPLPHTTLLEKVRLTLATQIDQQSSDIQRRAAELRLSTLTDREKELLDLVVAGHSNKQVASRLQISIKTVENHRARLMKKMGATNAAELVRLRMLAA